jgi:hypothetical protein
LQFLNVHFIRISEEKQVVSTCGKRYSQNLHVFSIGQRENRPVFNHRQLFGRNSLFGLDCKAPV